MSGKTVLVVDDEPHIRYMLDFKLVQAGFTVITATNGREAYELACRHRPDLIVTDFQMPGADGLELCVRLKMNADTARIPALMLTARGHKVPPSDLQKTNIRNLIPKPFSLRVLIAQIEELVGTPPPDGGRCDDAGATAA